jgi:hypothetical protein
MKVKKQIQESFYICTGKISHGICYFNIFFLSICQLKHPKKHLLLVILEKEVLPSCENLPEKKKN